MRAEHRGSGLHEGVHVEKVDVLCRPIRPTVRFEDSGLITTCWSRECPRQLPSRESGK